jgi:hypothetical protein
MHEELAVLHTSNTTALYRDMLPTSKRVEQEVAQPAGYRGFPNRTCSEYHDDNNPEASSWMVTALHHSSTHTHIPSNSALGVSCWYPVFCIYWAHPDLRGYLTTIMKHCPEKEHGS